MGRLQHGPYMACGLYSHANYLGLAIRASPCYTSMAIRASPAAGEAAPPPSPSAASAAGVAEVDGVEGTRSDEGGGDRSGWGAYDLAPEGIGRA